MKTPLTIETSIIARRICKPCTGSKETNGREAALLVCVQGGCDAAADQWHRKDATHGSVDMEGHVAVNFLSQISTQAL